VHVDDDDDVIAHDSLHIDECVHAVPSCKSEDVVGYGSDPCIHGHTIVRKHQ